MRQLGLSGAAGSTRLSSLGSRSLPAIKLFLQGEQLFRRASFDSARRAYERAIAVDSSFGLAMNRLAFVLGWQSVAYDDESTRLMLTAARFISGLSPRDSMHLTAGALWARLLMFEPDSSWWTKGQLLLSTLRDMNARSPGDFAVWNLLGEARFHLAGALGASWGDALDAFDRAIAIDSAFGPAWVHPISIALGRDSVSAARRYAQGLHDRRAREGREDWVSVVSDVLAGGLADSSQLDRRLAALSLEGIFEVWASTSKWFDSAETSIRVGRAFAAARPTGNTGFSDPAFRQGFFVQSLIDRGHFREALRINSADLDPELPYVAAMGIIPADSANGVFDRWVRDGNRSAHIALVWWAGRADSAAIRRFAVRARARSQSNVGDERHYAAFEMRAADAYLALARRDTTRAVATLLALPDSLCPTCYAHRLTLSQLLLGTGRASLADSILRRELTALQLRSPMADFQWRIARARAAEETGATQRAIMWYEIGARAYARGDSVARSLSQDLAQKVAALRGAARS
jgi:serine/threonine-protein kinase